MALRTIPLPVKDDTSSRELALMPIVNCEYSDLDELWVSREQIGVTLVINHPGLGYSNLYRLGYGATTPSNAIAITDKEGWYWEPAFGSRRKNQIAVTSAAAVTLTAAQSGSTIHTTGNGGTAVVNLPAALPGTHFRFVVMTAFALQIEPATGETIGLPSTGVQEAANDYITADAVNEYVELECITAGAWVPVNYLGTWTGQ